MEHTDFEEEAAELAGNASVQQKLRLIRQEPEWLGLDNWLHGHQF